VPINLDLIENGHILWFKMEGSWSPQEIVQAKEKTRAIFTQAKNPVHAMIDLRGASFNMSLITASQQVIGGDPLPNAGQIAVVGVPRLMRMMVEPLLRMSNSSDPITFFNSIDEAKTYLQRQIASKR
jgi:hypothetical protein